MKVKVLNPQAFRTMDKPPVGSDIIDLPEAAARAVIEAGYAEMAPSKVERATKAPGEKRAVARPAKEQ